MRTRKAFLNITMAAVCQIVTLICGLITPRLILSSFGSTYNGVINSATQFLGMISILTLGITGATRVALYKTLGNGDALGTSRIMKATKRYMRKVALCLIAYAALLCLIYPYISHNDLNKTENALLIAVVSIGVFAQYFFGISNHTLLQADQASYIVYALDIGKTIANLAVVALLIKLGRSIYEVKLGSSLVFLITPAIMNAYVRRRYKLTNDCEPDETGIKERGAVAFHSVANLVHNNVDLVLLTLFADAKLISVYTVYYLVVGKIKQLTQVVTSGIEAAFGNMWARGEYKTLKKNFRAYEYVMFTFTAVVFTCVGLLILPFISNYTYGVTDIDYIRPALAVLITFAEAFHCVRQPYLTLVQATGFYKETKNGAMFEALINLAISLILINVIGIEGVIIGTLAANLFRTAQYALFVSKTVIHRSILEVVMRTVWLFATSAAIVAVSLPLLHLISFPSGWGGWILMGFTVFCMACVVTFVSSLIFYRSDLSFVFGILKRMFRRKKNSKAS